MMNRRSSGRLLATVDVEIANDRDLAAQIDALWRLEEDLRDWPTTWFCTADAAEQFAEPLRALAKSGHGIGCHGLDHGQRENYRTMPVEVTMGALREATARVEAALGVRPRCFRGPRMTTSAATQQALRSLHYRADFSVCARRFDFAAASCFDWRWSRVSGAPYRPARRNPFERSGPPTSDDLIVVPLSGLGLPLCSGTVYLTGRSTALALARAARYATNAPLVYLFHSYEFTPLRSARDGRPWHQRLYPREPDVCYRLNRQFLGDLRDRLRLRPMAAEAFLQEATNVRSETAPANHTDRL